MNSHVRRVSVVGLRIVLSRLFSNWGCCFFHSFGGFDLGFCFLDNIFNHVAALSEGRGKGSTSISLAAAT